MKRTNPTTRNRRNADAGAIVDESSMSTSTDDGSISSSSASSSSAESAVHIVAAGTAIKTTRKRLARPRHHHYAWWNKMPTVAIVRNAVLSVGVVTALWHVAHSGDADTSMGVLSRRGLLRSTSLSSTSTSIDNKYDKGEEDSFCTLYMSPSTLGPNAGFGIFTAKSFARDDPIKFMDGPSIPVTDPYQIRKASHLKVLDDKWWGELKGQPNQMRFEAESVMEYVAGFGSLPNFHPYLANLSPREPKRAVDHTALNWTSPGAGALSAYTGKDIYAERDIVAGEELFLDYGESYFDESPEIYEGIPREEDYYDASAFLRPFKEELLQAKDGNQALSPRDKELTTSLLRKMKSAVAEAYSPRSASLLPASLEDLANIADGAFVDIDADPLGSNSEDESDEGRIRFSLAREMSTHHVTPSWLHRNGFCLDNIVRNVSTIPDAGNGGFAARALKAGEVIVPVPLYHVAERELLRTYPVHIDQSGTFIRNETRLNGPLQLLANYCFGHDDSSLLLCSITAVMHLNHCSTRINGGQCGSNTEKGPNARLQWATKWHPETKKWLNSSVEEIDREKDRVLNLEVVATRQIDKGAEILIDYGPEWEMAFERHKAKWVLPGTSDQLSESATVLNEEYADPIAKNDLRNDRSPPGSVMTGCWYRPEREYSKDYDDMSASEDDIYPSDETESAIFRRRSAEAASNKKTWNALPDEDILSRYAIDGSHFVDDRDYVSPHFWPCSVVSKDEGNNGADMTYTVRIFQSKSHHRAQWEKEKVPLYLTNYPRSSIRYFVKPYRSIQHLPGAFRRFIGLPNNMWPDKWKNRRRGARQGEFQVGDRVTFASSSNKAKTGIVLHFFAGEGYVIFSVRSGKIRTGVSPTSMKLDVRVEELDIDKFYA